PCLAVTAPTESLPASEIERIRRRLNVLGVGVDVIDPGSAVDSIFSAIRRRDGGYVCVTGVHGVMEAQRDPAVRAILNRSLLTTPDGMPLVWIGRARGFAEIDRVYGPDLMLEICRRSVESGESHFLLGGGNGVAARLTECLIERFPGLRVSG